MAGIASLVFSTGLLKCRYSMKTQFPFHWDTSLAALSPPALWNRTSPR